MRTILLFVLVLSQFSHSAASDFEDWFMQNFLASLKMNILLLSDFQMQNEIGLAKFLSIEHEIDMKIVNIQKAFLTPNIGCSGNVAMDSYLAEVEKRPTHVMILVSKENQIQEFVSYLNSTTYNCPTVIVEGLYKRSNVISFVQMKDTPEISEDIYLEAIRKNTFLSRHTSVLLMSKNYFKRYDPFHGSFMNHGKQNPTEELSMDGYTVRAGYLPYSTMYFADQAANSR